MQNALVLEKNFPQKASVFFRDKAVKTAVYIVMENHIRRKTPLPLIQEFVALWIGI